MENKKKLRCPIGVPGGVFAALVGLGGIICCAIRADWPGLAVSAALFFLAGPFVRVTMMVHAANDRLDELESRMNEKE
jgi:hypothetical protein